MKQIVLSLFLFLSLSLQAQAERRDTLMSDSLQTDSVIPAKPSAFKRAIRKFMNFSDFDTLYISPNRYNYALMTTHFSNFEYYSVTSNLPQPQKLSFSPNPHNKIGLYFGWRWIFLGWSVDVDDIYRKTNRRNKGTEFDLSLYSSKLGVDIFYRRTGNNYKIHKINGFPEDVPANYSEKFNGIKVDIKGLNLYYIFNNRKFSYPAAFSQSTNQRRNAGSFIAGFSISKHNLEFDYAELPAFILEAMNPAMKVNNIKYTNANIIRTLKNINQNIHILASREIPNMESTIKEYQYYNPAIEVEYIDYTRLLPQLEAPEEVLKYIQLYLYHK